MGIGLGRYRRPSRALSSAHVFFHTRSLFEVSRAFPILARMAAATSGRSAIVAVGQAGSAGSTTTPPTAIVQKAAPKTISEAMTVPLEDISTDTDSGWRRLDPRRRDQLKATFELGEYGQNLLRMPSILHVHGQNLKCKDGKLKLADGKHTIEALKATQSHLRRTGGHRNK